jgi:CxxC motif-containing protein (DUF1111 family)
LLALCCGGIHAAAVADDATSDETATARLQEGRSLFLREWLPGEAPNPGGDGLGPVFNDSSCVACHNGGTTGGGGPRSKNVDILSAASMGVQLSEPLPPPQSSFAAKSLKFLLGIETAATERRFSMQATQPKPDRKALIEFHPGFRTANSVVLHRFSVDSNYEMWRSGAMGFGGFGATTDPDAQIGVHRMLAQNEQNVFQAQTNVGMFFLTRSQRNPTALFGTGLLDSIPDEVLNEQAKKRFEGHPEVAGRVSLLKDGRIGKFGWKAQTASLDDFVLTACAVELGLEVPGHTQGGLPMKPDQKAPGLDLSAEQCASLTAYVRNLPKPSQLNTESAMVREGEALFTKVGCANCHAPKLGDVDGLYSDLLLHDMGQDLGDTGQYGVFTPDSSEPEIEDEIAPGGIAVTAPTQNPDEFAIAQPTQLTAVAVEGVLIPTHNGFQMMGAPSMSGIAPNRPKQGVASRQEWRTPPLWGLRDSGPYLHDGRASTLERAIALHSGEASSSTRAYFSLNPDDRLKLQFFLRSLAAPTNDGTAVAGR